MAKQPKNPKVDAKEEVISRAPRSNVQARARARDPNSIEIPLDLERAFKQQGYKLRWVRIVDARTKQSTNERVNFFLTIGGDIVSPQEIKKMDATFLTGLTKYDYREDFADEDDDRGKGSVSGIKKGDLLLMKIPLDYVQERLEANREMVEEQLTAAQHEYKRNGGADVFVDKFKHGRARVQVQEGFFE